MSQLTSSTSINIAGNSYQFLDQSQLTSQTYGNSQDNYTQLSYGDGISQLTGQTFGNYIGSPPYETNLDEMNLQHLEPDANFDSTRDNENNLACSVLLLVGEGK